MDIEFSAPFIGRPVGTGQGERVLEAEPCSLVRVSLQMLQTVDFSGLESLSLEKSEL